MNARSWISTERSRGIRASSNPWRLASRASTSIPRPSLSVGRCTEGTYFVSRRREPHDVGQVQAGCGAGPPWRRHAGDRLHPRRRRVEPALPWVNQRDEPAFVGIALAVQPFVKGDELREELGEERTALGRRQGLRDPPRGDRSHRWLRDARRLDVAGRERVAPRLPDPSAADVGYVAGEEHVGDHAVRPLSTEERSQLGPAARVGVDPGEPDRDEARVPEPLVRVERYRRAGPVAAAVPVEDVLRAACEFRSVYPTASRYVLWCENSMHSATGRSCSAASRAGSGDRDRRRRHQARVTVR